MFMVFEAGKHGSRDDSSKRECDYVDVLEASEL